MGESASEAALLADAAKFPRCGSMLRIGDSKEDLSRRFAAPIMTTGPEFGRPPTSAHIVIPHRLVGPLSTGIFIHRGPVGIGGINRPECSKIDAVCADSGAVVKVYDERALSATKGYLWT